MSKSNLNNQSDAKKQKQPGIDYQPDFFSTSFKNILKVYKCMT